MCRFNLDEEEVRMIVEPWSREQVIDVGERKWSPHTARLTILEGPHLEVQQLAMGRGWRAAQHESKDVTERLIEAAAAAEQASAQTAQAPATDVSAPVQAPAPAQAPGQPPAAAAADAPVPAGPAELHSLASLLGNDPSGLLGAWRAVASLQPGLAPSESLALAEQTLNAPGADPR